MGTPTASDPLGQRQTWAEDVFSMINGIEQRIMHSHDELENAANRAFGMKAEVDGPAPSSVRPVRSGDFGRILDRLDDLETQVVRLQRQVERFGLIS